MSQRQTDLDDFDREVGSLEAYLNTPRSMHYTSGKDGDPITIVTTVTIHNLHGPNRRDEARRLLLKHIDFIREQES